MSKARGLAGLGNAFNDGALSNRNLIINGAMQVAQRGTSVASVSTGGYYTCDRWKFVETGTPTAVYTFTQDTTGPNGFSNSFKVATTTADATPTGLNAISYFVEGFDLQRLGYGSSDANTSTLSFWVKSSQTGTCAVLVYLFDGNLSLTLNYTVDAADTWEYKTLNIPTNTSQAIANDNTAGLELDFVIMADTATYGTTAQTTWDTYSSATRAYGQTLNAAATTSDYFQITGVQLEVGDTATPFEHRSYGQELALCQRYFEKSYNAHEYGGGNTNAGIRIFNGSVDGNGISYQHSNFKVVKRTSPTMQFWDASGNSGVWTGSRSGQASTGITVNSSSSDASVYFWFDIGGSWVPAQFYGHFYADAEL